VLCVVATAGCTLTTDLDALGAATGSSASSSTSAASAGGYAGSGGDAATTSSGAAGFGGANGSSSSTGGANGGAPTKAYADEVLDDAPAGYWRLGDPATPIAVDTAGGLHGTYLGGVTVGVEGAVGSDPDTAAEFDGNSDLVQIADVFGFTGVEPFTLELWVRPAPLDDVVRSLVSKEASTGGIAQGYRLRSRSDGLAFFRWTAAGGDWVIAKPLDGEVWSHVAVTYDGATLILYVDGTEVGLTISSAAVEDHGAPLVIGAGVGGTTYFWEGAIDEVAIYPVALSASRIEAHYLAGLAP
jgi:hypothetical protein